MAGDLGATLDGQGWTVPGTAGDASALTSSGDVGGVLTAYGWETSGDAGSIDTLGGGGDIGAALGVDGWTVDGISFSLRDIDPATNAIAEGAQIGDGVGVQAYFDDDTLNPVTYSITTQSTPGAFQIDATTGVVTVATEGLLDFEARPTETVTVKATEFVYVLTDGEATYIDGDPVIEVLAEVERVFTIAVTGVVVYLNELWGADRLVWLTESGAEPSVWRI